MSTFHRSIAGMRLTVAVVTLLMGLSPLAAQGVPTVQQMQFRSHWVGEQVDQIPVPPLNGLGAIVGPLQTQDQVDRDVAASFANLKSQSPFSFKPVLSLGWQISNQNNQSQSTKGSAVSSSASVSPSLAILYDRDHGPWTTSAGYSAGFTYYPNSGYTGGGGTSSQPNPISQTAFGNAGIQMSRYTFNTTASASSGTGYDFSSGSNNRQISYSASMNLSYILTTYTTVNAAAGLGLQNSSQSTNTPNNNTGSLFAALTPTYALSDKTHLSAVFGAGSSFQSLQQGTNSVGGVANTNASGNNLSYAQLLANVKYDLTGKLSTSLGLGVRDVVGNQALGGSSYTGLKPSWTAAFTYTPTPKTSVSLSLGEQGSDVVPELSMTLGWNPRQKTSVSVSVSQTQAFANSVNAQYQVSSGISGSINQQLFKSVSLGINAGYTQQRFINLAASQNPQSSVSLGQNAGQLPGNMFFAQASLNWRIRDGVSLDSSLTGNTGQSTGGSAGNQLQIFYAISLNFSL